MCKCLSDFVPPDLSCKCYIDCLHFICILANRIGLARHKLSQFFFAKTITEITPACCQQKKKENVPAKSSRVDMTKLQRS